MASITNRDMCGWEGRDPVVRDPSPTDEPQGTSLNGAGRKCAAAPTHSIFLITEVRLVRIALAVLLDGIAGMRVVGTSDLGTELPPVALNATILVELCSSSDLEAIRGISRSHPNVRLIALGVPQTKEAILGCAEAGVAGFVLADASLDDLIETVECVQSGDPKCPPQVVAVLLRRIAAIAGDSRRGSKCRDRLTAREWEIAALIEHGLSNRQIADRLHIALPTVKNHVHHILDKLGLSGRTEIAAAVRPPAPAEQVNLPGNRQSRSQQVLVPIGPRTGTDRDH